MQTRSFVNSNTLRVFLKVMAAAVENSSVFVMLVSPQYKQSANCQAEVVVLVRRNSLPGAGTFFVFISGQIRASPEKKEKTQDNLCHV